MSALAAGERQPAGGQAEAEWSQLEAAAPRVAAVMHRYLRQLGTFLAPRSVDAAENALRQLARWMITEAGLDSVAALRRDDIEDYKVWLAARPRGRGQVITAETHRQRMRTVRQFFERIIEWDWPDAPPRNPVIAWEIPKKPEPLPKFLDDRDAAKLMAAARASTDLRDRLVVELLARTGMRASELADLDADAVVRIGAGHWLHIPLGKLHTDRYVPLHPSSWSCSPPGPPPTWSTYAATSGWPPTTAGPWTGTSSPGLCTGSAAPPGCPPCTHTGSGTRWPPRRSTVACGWKPSPPCSATRKWK